MEKVADKWLKPAGAIIVTLFTGAILLWWLWLVKDKIGSIPQLDDKGNVILDQWQRAKDILLVVVPLFTAAMGYWIGSKESANATDRADKAEVKADEKVAKAEEKASRAEEKANLALGTLDPTVLRSLRDTHPTVFLENVSLSQPQTLP